MDRSSLKSKVAFISGSTSGIGKAIAETLAESGCDIALNGFGDLEEIERLRLQLQRESDARACYCPADFKNPEQIRDAVRQASEQLGPIDILVNNAGIQRVAPVHEFSEVDWDDIIAINLNSVFHASKAVLPSMYERRWGRIINIASVHGLVASIHKPAYIAAKHGVVGLTKQIAIEAAPHQVTCNAICPAWVKTELMNKQIRDRMRQEGLTEEQVVDDMLAEKQPIGRFLDVKEIAALAQFLCSDGAAGITGAALPIDGGWTAQ